MGKVSRNLDFIQHDREGVFKGLVHGSDADGSDTTQRVQASSGFLEGNLQKWVKWTAVKRAKQTNKRLGVCLLQNCPST
jgi:hypothetical protein